MTVTEDTSEHRDFDGKFCHACGAKVHQSARACPACGAVLSPGPRRNRIAAAILALVLGGLGVHKFYLGRPVQGLLYLLFCWTFIPTIIAFIEFLIYIFQSDESFERKYG